MRTFLRKVEQALGSPRRNVVASLGLVIVGVLAIVIGNMRIDQLRAEQHLDDGIVSVIAGSAQMLSLIFGPGGLDEDQLPWLGFRVYDKQLKVWVELETRSDDQLDKQLDERIVVLVHGLDEPGGIWDQLAPALADAGYTAVRFDYANDQAIALSATGLLDSLGELREYGVKTIDFVCHSMGGLVVRDTITREGFGEKGITVGRLITIGTPHGGSPWARLRAMSEIREQVQRWVESDDLDPQRLLGFARDGVGQAGADLLPGSDFLLELDQRTLPDGIAVTCIVGQMTSKAGVQAGSVFAASAMRDLVGSKDAWAIMDAIDQFGHELGDGVVPMSSAVLDGVDDVVVLQANHRAMVRTVELSEVIRQIGGLGASDEPPAIAVVLDRLARE